VVTSQSQSINSILTHSITKYLKVSLIPRPSYTDDQAVKESVFSYARLPTLM